MSSLVEDALTHLVKGIVEHPEDVTVRSRGGGRRRDGREGASFRSFEVRVHPEDIGRVIGRGGRTATALRTVVTALHGGRAVRIDFLDLDER